METIIGWRFGGPCFGGRVFVVEVMRESCK